MKLEQFPIDQDIIVKKIRALRARQPIGDIYFATVDFKLIQQMTFFDVRRRISETLRFLAKNSLVTYSPEQAKIGTQCTKLALRSSLPVRPQENVKDRRGHDAKSKNGEERNLGGDAPESIIQAM